MPTEKESAKDAAAAPASAKGSAGGWLPVIVVLVLVPAISFAMAEYVLFPRLEQRLVAAGGVQPAGGHAGATTPGKASGPRTTPKADPTFSHEFKDIVCNLAGAMKSRYIKVSFTAYSANPELATIVADNRAKLLDATGTVLSALTLADLEDGAVKPRVKSQLVEVYESVLRDRVIEEIYFSEWVIQ